MGNLTIRRAAVAEADQCRFMNINAENAGVSLKSWSSLQRKKIRYVLNVKAKILRKYCQHFAEGLLAEQILCRPCLKAAVAHLDFREVDRSLSGRKVFKNPPELSFQEDFLMRNFFS